MALRRALIQGARRRSTLSSVCCVSRLNSNAAFCKEGSGVSSWSNLQSGSLFFSRGYAKKQPAKAKKGRAQQKVSEDEDEDEDEEIEDVDPEAPKEAAKEHMELAIEALSTELGKLRTGRANAGMLDHVEVELEDKHVSLTQVAAISVSNPQTLTVMPFDSSVIKKVETAIRASPLDLNPVAGDQTITVPVPRLTKELCESMCKLAAKAGEDTKKSIRRGRQTAMDEFKKMTSSLSKDELKRHEKEVDELTKQYVKMVDEACKKKEAEISKGV